MKAAAQAQLEAYPYTLDDVTAYVASLMTGGGVVVRAMALGGVRSMLGQAARSGRTLEIKNANGGRVDVQGTVVRTGLLARTERFRLV